MSKNADAISRVLVTVQEGNRGDLDTVAKGLRSAGMNVAEQFPLGGVIAGDVATRDLPKVRNVPGVEVVEEEPIFQA